jgi:hypothetical protein
MQNFSIKKISGFGGIKPLSKASPLGQGLALETPGSNLQKIFDFIQRVSYGEKQGVIDPEGFASGFMKGLKGEAKPSGSELIQYLRGGKAPETGLGKFAQTTGGLALDIFNPLAPENYLGAGLVTKGGSALMKLGKLAKFTEGLQTGERALLAAKLPFMEHAIPLLPQFASRAAGKVLSGIGAGLKEIPGVPSLIKTFAKPANKLAQFTGKIASRSAQLSNDEIQRVGADSLNKIISQGAKEIEKGGLAQVNPKVYSHYIKQGYSPLEMANKEVARLVEGPTISAIRESQGGLKLAKPGVGRKFEKIAKEALKDVPITGKSIPILESAAKIFTSTGEKLGSMKANLGVSSTLQGRMPRQLSEEAKSLQETLGSGVSGTPANQERVIKELTTEEADYLQKNSPELSAKYFGSIIGSKPLVQKAGMLDGFKQTQPKAASIYETDAAKLYGNDLNKSTRTVATGEAIHDFVKNPDFSRPTREAWGEHAGRVVPIQIPPMFSKMFNNQSGKGLVKNRFTTKGTIWVDESIAHEAKNMMGILSDADKANDYFAYGDSMWKGFIQAWKRWTLYSFPGSIFTVMRNFQGNTFLSAVRGALSKEGTVGALRAMPVFLKAGKNPQKFKEMALKMGPEGKELLAAKAGNLFDETQERELFQGKTFGGKVGGGVEKLFGVTIGGKANGMVENLSRFQHYLTRRKQGWSVQAAIADTRDSLYDYVNGLPPALQRLKNSPVGLPFVTWMYHNIPAMAQQALQHPGRIIISDRFKRNIENMYGGSVEGGQPDERALSEYVKGDLNIRLYQDPTTGKWTYLRLKGGLPSADLEDITSISKFVDLMKASLAPTVKTPLELATNRSFFFKGPGGEPSPIEEYPGQLGEFLGMRMPRTVISVLRNARVLGEINKYMPSGEGAPRLSPAEIGVRQLGFSTVPVDLARDAARAKKIFRQRLSDLKIEKNRLLMGRRPTDEIEQKIKQLIGSGYKP